MSSTIGICVKASANDAAKRRLNSTIGKAVNVSYARKLAMRGSLLEFRTR
jgi:hypothetical protein